MATIQTLERYHERCAYEGIYIKVGINQACLHCAFHFEPYQFPFGFDKKEQVEFALQGRVCAWGLSCFSLVLFFLFQVFSLSPFWHICQVLRYGLECVNYILSFLCTFVILIPVKNRGKYRSNE